MDNAGSPASRLKMVHASEHISQSGIEEEPFTLSKHLGGHIVQQAVKAKISNRGFRILLFIFLVLSVRLFAAEIPVGGKVVWWGRDHFWKSSPTDRTNGVIENDDGILTNVVSISASPFWSALLFMSDGTVMKAGQDSIADHGLVLSNFTNVASVALVGNSYWVVKRDGTVTQSGIEPSPYDVAGLSNVVSITGVEAEGYFVLKMDGSLWSFRGQSVLDLNGMPPADDAWLRPVQVSGKVVTNVKSATLVGFVPYLLKRDGTVWRLDLDPRDFPDQGITTPPFRNGSAIPVKINGNPLSNVVAIAGGGLHYLALKPTAPLSAWAKTSPEQPPFRRD